MCHAWSRVLWVFFGFVGVDAPGLSTPVMNHSFSTTGALEGPWALKSGTLESLSVRFDKCLICAGDAVSGLSIPTSRWARQVQS